MRASHTANQDLEVLKMHQSCVTSRCHNDSFENKKPKKFVNSSQTTTTGSEIARSAIRKLMQSRNESPNTKDLMRQSQYQT